MMCMSRILEELPPDSRGAPEVYPWSDWTDGRIWEITRGEDFTLAVQSMAGLLRMRASRLGLSIQQRVRGDVIAFRFMPKVQA